MAHLHERNSMEIFFTSNLLEKIDWD